MDKNCTIGKVGNEKARGYFGVCKPCPVVRGPFRMQNHG